MAIPEKLKRKQFNNKLDNLKEELRVLKERANHAFKKIRHIENKKEDLIKDIKKELSNFDYKSLKDKLENEYLKLITGELNWTKQLMSLIYVHVTNFKEDIGNVNPDSIIQGVSQLFLYYKNIQDMLEIRITDLKDEIEIIKGAIEKGIPLYDLYKLNEDEVRENALDRRFSDLRHPLIKRVHDMEQRAAKRIEEMEDLIKRFEKKHGSVENIAGIGESVVQFYASLSSKVEGLDLALFAIEGGVALFAAPEALAGVAAFHTFSTFLAKLTKVTEAADMIEKLEGINEKLIHLTKIPGFDDNYLRIMRETKGRFKEMEIA